MRDLGLDFLSIRRPQPSLRALVIFGLVKAVLVGALL